MALVNQIPTIFLAALVLLNDHVACCFKVSSVRPTTERMASLSSLPRKSEFAEAFDPILIACRDPRLKGEFEKKLSMVKEKVAE